MIQQSCQMTIKIKTSSDGGRKPSKTIKQIHCGREFRRPQTRPSHRGGGKKSQLYCAPFKALLVLIQFQALSHLILIYVMLLRDMSILSKEKSIKCATNFHGKSSHSYEKRASKYVHFRENFKPKQLANIPKACPVLIPF